MRCQGAQTDLVARAPESVTGPVHWRCLKQATHTVSFSHPLKWHDQSRSTWKLCDDCGKRLARDTGLVMSDPGKRLEIANAPKVD